MSHAQEVAKSEDEMIVCMGTRESGIMDYRIGRKISVSWRGKDRYLCHTCLRISDCEHTRRVDKYRQENFA